MKFRAFLAAAMLAVAFSAQAVVPTPTVTGPIPSTVKPGDSSRDYNFFASDHPLGLHGYIEEEYFVEGTANRYNTPNLATGSIVSSGHPYKTRIVVRRPAERANFNGVVLVEWLNVTNGFDADNLWFFAWEHVLRSGYAWVGVSAQLTGVNQLKSWSPARYASLDVTAGGTVPTDVLSYDIFSQVGQAIANPKGVNVLGRLRPRVLIATGESQSAQRLATFINSVVPMDIAVYDAHFLLSNFGQAIRSDVNAPTFKVVFEWDVQSGEAAVRAPDSNRFHSWEVAGTAHVDHHLRLTREPLELRDMLTSSEATLAPTCTVPTIGSRVPNHYVVSAGIDALVRWHATGSSPPTSPRFEIASMTGNSARIARDGFNLAQGGIRLSQIEVPTAQNVGENTGAGACARWGYHTPFDVETLRSMYYSRADYVGLVTQVTRENLQRGFILKEDARTTIRQALETNMGRGGRVSFDWQNDPDFGD